MDSYENKIHILDRSSCYKVLLNYAATLALIWRKIKAAHITAKRWKVKGHRRKNAWLFFFFLQHRIADKYSIKLGIKDMRNETAKTQRPKGGEQNQYSGHNSTKWSDELNWKQIYWCGTLMFSSFRRDCIYISWISIFNYYK